MTDCENASYGMIGFGIFCALLFVCTYGLIELNSWHIINLDYDTRYNLILPALISGILTGICVIFGGGAVIGAIISYLIEG